MRIEARSAKEVKYDVYKDEAILKLFASCVYGEACGETFQGQQAVASVFFMRWKSGRYGKTLSEVLSKASASYYNKSRQFQKAITQTLDKYEWRRYDVIEDYCQDLLEGKTQPIINATHFENIEAFGKPNWYEDMVEVDVIGNHRFYEEKK